MYVLTTTLPGAHIDDDNTKRFFAEFRATNEETATSILENNADKLFNDLLLKDSLGFQEAYSALAEVQFGEKDIVVLMEKATLQYPKYENNYQSVNEQLLSQVETLLKKYPSKEHQDQVNAFIPGSYQKENKSLCEDTN